MMAAGQGRCDAKLAPLALEKQWQQQSWAPLTLYNGMRHKMVANLMISTLIEHFQAFLHQKKHSNSSSTYKNANSWRLSSSLFPLHLSVWLFERVSSFTFFFFFLTVVIQSSISSRHFVSLGLQVIWSLSQLTQVRGHVHPGMVNSQSQDKYTVYKQAFILSSTLMDTLLFFFF